MSPVRGGDVLLQKAQGQALDSAWRVCGFVRGAPQESAEVGKSIEERERSPIAKTRRRARNCRLSFVNRSQNNRKLIVNRLRIDLNTIANAIANRLRID